MIPTQLLTQTSCGLEPGTKPVSSHSVVYSLRVLSLRWIGYRNWVV